MFFSALRVRGVGVAAFALAASALALSACQESSKPAGSPASQTPEVGVVTLHPQAVPITVTVPGRTVASGVAEIRPQVDGLIQKVVFEAGRPVKAGDLLYQIDPSSYQAALDSANAALEKAQAAVPTAQAKVDRYSSLVGANTITQQNLDDAKSTLAQAQADVASAQAAVDTAKINLAFTKVTAPIGGLIGNSTVTQGALVTAKQTDALATIRQIDPMYVDVVDSSTNMLKFRNLMESGKIARADGPPAVQFILDDGSAFKQTGKMQSIEPTISETTGTLSLRATVANPNRELLPGMYVQAVIAIGTNKSAYLLPQRAVSRNAKGIATAMFVDAKGNVETRALVTQQAVGSSWLVDSGINDGDKLIVEGGQNVAGGQAVKATEVKLDAAGVVQSSDAAASSSTTN